VIVTVFFGPASPAEIVLATKIALKTAAAQLLVLESCSLSDALNPTTMLVKMA
jgi:hypothetical protein